MRKETLVIGASEESKYAISEGRKRGYVVTAFDGDSNAPGLRYADKAYVTDIRNYRNILNLLDYKPDFILPVPIGRYLVSTGAVNDALNIRGISKNAADICTDKYFFHNTLTKRKLRSGICHLIPSGDAAMDIFSDGLLFPIILKPRFGSGSRNVYIIKSLAEWNRLKQKIFPATEDYIIESAFSGEEYGVDGVVFDSRLYIILLRKKILTPPPFCQCVGYFSLPLDLYASLYSETTKYLQKAADAIGLNNCLFHCDIMIGETGMNIIEISGRPSGHNLHNLFTPLATGISMINSYIDFMEGKKPQLKPSQIQFMLISYFDFENCVIKGIPATGSFSSELKNSLLEYRCFLKPGYAATIENGHQLMERGFYILKGTSFNDLMNKRNMLKNYFRIGD